MNYIETIITIVIISILLAMVAGAGASEHKMALELAKEAAKHDAEIEQMLTAFDCLENIAESFGGVL